MRRIRKQFATQFFYGARLLHGVVDQKAKRRKFREGMVQAGFECAVFGDVAVFEQGLDHRDPFFIAFKTVKLSQINCGENFGVVFRSLRLREASKQSRPGSAQTCWPVRL